LEEVEVLDKQEWAGILNEKLYAVSKRPVPGHVEKAVKDRIFEAIRSKLTLKPMEVV